MFDENQLVVVKWNNTNRDYYEAKGYIYTKRYDELYIKVKDLKEGSAIKIKATCDYCGREYETQYDLVVKGRKAYPKDACAKCASLKANDVNFKKRAKNHFDKAREVCCQRGYILLSKEEDYTSTKMDIEFLCPVHGFQKMMLDNFIRGHECRDCSYEKRFDNVRHDAQYIKTEIEKVDGNILLNIEDYKNCTSHNLQIQCKCGNIFITSFVNYMMHNVNKCPSCSAKESVAEIRIREFLENQGIDFIQEKRFDDCRDNKPLPFDFYLPSNNIIIEFDGQHHYYPIRDKHSYIKTVEHDRIKNEYCQLHNINLIRIPYWEGSKIEEILTNKLNLNL